MNELCSEEEITQLLQAVQSDNGNDVAAIDTLLEEYPQDPRLHFLRGSVLASGNRLVEAYESMQQAVEIAPDFVIARFQLGFFELSSGNAQSAMGNWKPLEDLPEDHYIRRFVRGLVHMIHDEFDSAITELRQGIALNQENPPLNHDMQLIIDKTADLASSAEQGSKSEQAISSTSALLNQFPGPKTKH
ncbi:hypothetical protein [Sphingorhabdus sp. Alg239-R122]|uniref:tetratricopeptide repeat protein n=1 Tax=Sphingorhabdus sp. Alg239-R122 TaxID=2305989 RepID=UPI0013DC106B|nr:hypothetical protein [Sphingorhabdus sp. Alg239-R122]